MLHMNIVSPIVAHLILIFVLLGKIDTFIMHYGVFLINLLKILHKILSNPKLNDYYVIMAVLLNIVNSVKNYILIF